MICYVCGTTRNLITLASHDDEESMHICANCLHNTNNNDEEEWVEDGGELELLDKDEQNKIENELYHETYSDENIDEFLTEEFLKQQDDYYFGTSEDEDIY
jgi:hypothetical protein